MSRVLRLLAPAIAAGFAAACLLTPAPTSAPVTTASPVPPPTAGTAVAECDNPDAAVPYRLSYPAAWFAHPADPEAGVPPCTYFGPAPFEYEVPSRPEDAVWSISVQVIRTCIGEERPPIFTRTDVVDGFPATAAEFSYGRTPDLYLWTIELVQALECERSRTLVVHTAAWLPGDYQTNKGVADFMVSTLDFLTD